jgi:NDP-sugar pyrophosphorylase family protein
MEGEIMELFKVSKFLDTEHTIAKYMFDSVQNPWEVLPSIGVFIEQLGPMLPVSDFEQRGSNVWISKTATVAPTASITGPCIIDAGTEVRHCAFIRGNAIIGKHCVIGNSTEVKNSIIFDEVQIPHYNYVGDSILGFRSHLGAGAITSNVKNDKSNVEVNFSLGRIDTKLRKFGAVVGDYTQVGCNSVLNPGTIIGRNTSIYPLCSVRGLINENSIYKTGGKIVQKVKLKKEVKL